MRAESRASGSRSPESSSKKARAMLESRRVRSSFSFDPMAVAPLFEGMTFAIDVDCEDPDFVEEIEKMIGRLGGSVTRTSKMDSKTVLIWRRGDIETLQKADEIGCVSIGYKWIFECIEKGERLDLERYVVSKADRDDGLLRKELHIKRQAKPKRSSLGLIPKNPSRVKPSTDESRRKNRESLRMEKAFKNRDISEVLKGMASTLKDLCDDDIEFKNVLHKEIEPLATHSLEKTNLPSVADSRSKLKKPKRVENEPSAGKPTLTIPLSSFLRCLQNENHKMILYQGDFTELHDILKLKTAEGIGVVFFKAHKIFMTTSDVECIVVLDDSVNSLGLIYAMIKRVPVVNRQFVQACIRARRILPPAALPDSCIHAHYDRLKRDLFVRTTFKIHEPEKLKEMKLKVYTARSAVEYSGGRLSDVLSLVDIVVVLTDDEGNLPSLKSMQAYSTYFVSIVNERWLVDSIMAGTRLSCQDPRYEVYSDSLDMPKRVAATKPIVKSLTDYFSVKPQ